MTRPTVVISMESAEYHFRYWEKTKDVVDQFIDIMLNYRQSGHPGGSRSKVHALIGLLLSGRFRWDIRHPEAPLADRFVLGAGHTVPLVYAILAVFHEALRRKYRETGDSRYLVPRLEEHALFPEDLAGLRRQGGLSGHAEMAGKTLFLKWNTGPSGHGFPAAVGQALALKRAGVGDVKVCVLEGEGGLTPGASHEAKNSAWGLGLDNLFFSWTGMTTESTTDRQVPSCTDRLRSGFNRTGGRCSVRRTDPTGKRWYLPCLRCSTFPQTAFRERCGFGHEKAENTWYTTTSRTARHIR